VQITRPDTSVDEHESGAVGPALIGDTIVFAAPGAVISTAVSAVAQPIVLEAVTSRSQAKPASGQATACTLGSLCEARAEADGGQAPALDVHAVPAAALAAGAVTGSAMMSFSPMLSVALAWRRHQRTAQPTATAVSRACWPV